MKLLRWIAIVVFAPIVLLAGALIVVSVLGITVNLDKVRPMVEQAASSALNRKIQITGPVELLPTLTPSLEVQGVRIDNPEGWGSTDFVVVKLARIQLGLVDLFNKQINIPEIKAQGVSLILESRKDDVNNWSFAPAAKNENKTPKATEKAASPTENESGALAFKAVDKLSLKDIEVTYKDTVLQKTISFHLDELSGKAPAGQATTLHAKGSLQEQSYSFDLDAGALNKFSPKKQAWPVSLSGKVADTPFSAKGSIGQKDKEQQLSLDVAVAAVDIGALLSWLNVAENTTASTEELGLQLRLQGDSLHELLSQSAFNFSLKGGNLDLGNGKNKAGSSISKLNGNIGAKPGEAIAFDLTGVIDSTPVTISIKGMPLVKYVTEPGELPITIDFAAAGAELAFHGAVAMPVGSKNFNLGMKLHGDQLDSLNDFLQVDLPPFGPYNLEAQFAATPNGFDLSNLQIKVGSSDLTGSMSVDKSSEKPLFTVQLQSNVLQINDFELGGWSPDGNGDTEKLEEEGIEQASKEKDRKPVKVPPFLSPEALARFNSTLSIEMREVLSGKDLLGSGSLHSSVQDGRFSIDPLQLELADGDAKLIFSYYPTATETEIKFATTVKKLDLGILARRAKPESTMGGILSLDIELDSTASELHDLMAFAQGHFDLAFVPVNFDASVIDLWAVNLLSALASEVDGEPKSVINCLIASFGMEDGLMQERTIFMDTTHMSIEGEANINFKSEELKLKVSPKAKRPEFFSLATPVNVKGNFKDFGIAINKLKLTTSLASFITSPVHVPVRRIFAGERPQDGVEACQMAWDNRKIGRQREPGTGD